MGGLGESSPRSGFEGAGAPRQSQCITLGRLAPRHYAVRRRPRCPRLALPEARLDPPPPLPGNATVWRVPLPDGEVPSLPPPPLQGCGSNSNGIEPGSYESRPWFGTSD